MLDVLVSLDGWAAATGPSVEGLDPTGCLWWLDSIGGWTGSGPVRSGLNERPGVDGARGRAPLRNARIITINGTCVAPDDIALAEAEERFSRVLLTGNRRGDLVVDERYRGIARQVAVELNGESLFTRQGTQEATWSFSLVAPDPVKLSTELTTLSTARYTPGGGVTFPVTFPITFAPGSVPGLLAANNAGDSETWPTLKFVGPLVNPRAQLRGGSSLSLVMTVESGQAVEIDTKARTVMMGEASQRSKLSLDSRFFSLPPGGSEVVLTADSGAGSLEMQYRSAWY